MAVIFDTLEFPMETVFHYSKFGLSLNINFYLVGKIYLLSLLYAILVLCNRVESNKITTLCLWKHPSNWLVKATKIRYDRITHRCLKRLFIDFVTKMSYFTSQEVGNPVQMIKYVKISRWTTLLNLQVTFVERLFILKPFYWWFV